MSKLIVFTCDVLLYMYIPVVYTCIYMYQWMLLTTRGERERELAFMQQTDRLSSIKLIT